MPGNIKPFGLTGVYSGVDAMTLAHWLPLKVHADHVAIKPEPTEFEYEVEVDPLSPPPLLSSSPSTPSPSPPPFIKTPVTASALVQDAKLLPLEVEPRINLARLDVDALTCPQCERTFARRNLLLRHMTSCDDGGGVQPTVVGAHLSDGQRPTTTRQRLQKRKQWYNCTLCEYQTVQPWRIPDHLVRDHPETQRRQQPVRSAAIGMWYGM